MKWMLRSLIAAGFALAAGSASAETIRVTIKGMKFQPAEITAKVGDIIEWSNEDAMPHTATAAGDFDVVVPPGKVGSFTLAKAGPVDYKCRFHPSMKASIKVD